MPVGRRLTKPTEEQCRIAYEKFSKGLTIGSVCSFLGISYTTFYVWMKRGKDDKSGPFFEFVEKVEDGIAACEQRWIESTEAEPGGSRWLLSRRMRRDFGEKVEIQHSGSINFNVTWDESASSDDDDFDSSED